MTRSVQVYTWGLGIAGLAALLVYAPHLSLTSLLPTVGLAICAAAFDRLPIILPNRIRFSLGSTFVFLAYATHGAASAFLVEFVAALVVASTAKRLVQKVFNLGQLLLSLFALHLTVTALGAGPGPLTLLRGAALLAGGMVFFAVNMGLVGVVIRLATRRRFMAVVRDLIAEGYTGVVGSLGMILPLLFTFHSGGWLTLLLFCGSLLAFRYAVNLYLEQKRVHLDSLGQLLSIVERKTKAAERHSAKVALLARTIAEAMKLPADDVDTIHAAGILHDIGEAEIDHRVLSVMVTKGIPTLADLEAYQEHAALGERLVQNMHGMARVAKLIRHHHEQWNGSGYPDGLAGSALPLGARILAAAEAIEGLAPDLDTRLAGVAQLVGTVVDPRLAEPLKAALRKANTPVAGVAAATEQAKVAQLQSTLFQALRSSQLLEAMGVGRFIQYERGSFRTFEGLAAEPPGVAEVTRLVRRSLMAQLPMRAQVVGEALAYDAYCLPTGEEAASLLLFDVTKALAVEREQTRRIFRAYRDVLSVATQGRLLMMDHEEAEGFSLAGELIGEIELIVVEDGRKARELVRESAIGRGWEQSAVFRLTVCVSEAVTNVFKHAGSGKVVVRWDVDCLRIIVSDHGTGIPYDILPRATLMAGYSTKRSMGKGFSVMLKYQERIRLDTGEQGTMVILEHRSGNGQPGGHGAEHLN